MGARLMLQIKSGGEHLLHVGAGAAEVSQIDRWPGGCWELSWQMVLPEGFRHRLLERGRRIEAYDGAVRTFWGKMQSADWEAGRFTAFGSWRDAEHYPALDSGGDLTTVCNIAIDAAITAGWDVHRSDDFAGGGLTASDTVADLMNVDELLTLTAKFVSQHPAVDANGRIYRASSDTTPTWIMTPSAVELGTADDDYASRVLFRFVNADDFDDYATADANDQAAADRFGPKVQMVDGTALGPINASIAAGIATGLVTDGRARPSFVDTITTTPWTLRTIGGEPADRSLVQYGQMIRLMGMFDNTHDLNGRTWLDIIVGETVKTWTNDRLTSLTIAPLGLTPRSFEDVQEEQARKFRDQQNKLVHL